MASYTHAQFASMCGLTNGNLTNYMSRGKVVRDKDGMYDTENPFNRDFMEKRGVKDSTKVAEPKKAEKKSKQAEAVRPELAPKKEPVQRYNSNGNEERGGHQAYGLEKKIRQLEAEKKQHEIELLSIKIDKLNAMVIPTDVVKLVLAQQFKNTVVAFKDGAEKFISRINKEVGLTREQSALIRGQLVSIINESVRESLSESKRNILAIVSDYQQTRGKGERKD